MFVGLGFLLGVFAVLGRRVVLLGGRFVAGSGWEVLVIGCGIVEGEGTKEPTGARETGKVGGRSRLEGPFWSVKGSF